MVICNFAGAIKEEWIVDSGASNHMTGNFELLVRPFKMSKDQNINLPTGHTSKITYCGDVILEKKIELKNVLYIYLSSNIIFFQCKSWLRTPNGR